MDEFYDYLESELREIAEDLWYDEFLNKSFPAYLIEESKDC